MVLINTSYTMFGTSVHSFSGILSIISNSLNLFFTFIIKSPGILFRSYPNALVAFPTFFNLSLNFALRTSWSEEQSAPGLVFADFIELFHLLHQSVDVHVTLPNYIPFDDLTVDILSSNRWYFNLQIGTLRIKYINWMCIKKYEWNLCIKL